MYDLIDLWLAIAFTVGMATSIAMVFGGVTRIVRAIRSAQS